MASVGSLIEEIEVTSAIGGFFFGLDIELIGFADFVLGVHACSFGGFIQSVDKHFHDKKSFL